MANRNWLGDVTKALGVTPDYVTSSYRSQQEQDALVKAGKTRAVRSAHTAGNGFDLRPVKGETADGALRRLQDAGIPVTRVRAETGKGQNQGTGAHWHFEGDFQGQLGPNGGQQVATSQPTNRTEIANPFQAGPEVKQQFDKTMGKAKSAESLIESIIPQIDQVQEQREQSLQAAVDTKKALNNEVQARTQATLDKVKPLFAQRQAIADRQLELTTMNPIKRGFLSLFDASYDRKHLGEVDSALANQIGTAGQEYEQTLRLQDSLLKVVESNFQGDEAIAQLDLANMDQDMQLAAQSFSASDQVFTTAIKGLESQSAILEAQQKLTTQVLSDLSPAQVQTYLGRVKQNGGQPININGAMVGEGQLQELSNNWTMQQNRLEEYQVSLETARLNQSAASMRLVQEKQDQLIGTMSGRELDQAIADGGKFKGQQLDLRVLGQAKAAQLQRDDIVVAGIQARQGGAVAVAGIRQTQNALRFTNARTLQMFGTMPKEMIDLNRKIAASAAVVGQTIGEGKAKGVGNQAAVSQLKTIEGWMDQRNKVVEQMALRWAGGNQELLPLAVAFLNGQPLSSPAAVKGLISLARTGLPAGQKLSGSAGAAFAAAKGAIKALESSQAGMSIDDMLAGKGGKENARQMQLKLEATVAAAVRDKYNGNQFESMLGASPVIAKQMGHPAGAIDPGALSAAINAGDDEGYRRIATDMGISEQQAKVLFSSGSNGPNSSIWKTVQQNKPEMDWAVVNRQLQAYQMQSTFQALDTSVPTINGSRPSAVWANLLASPRFQAEASRRSLAMGQSSFMDFAASSISDNSLGSQMADYGNAANASLNAMNYTRNQEKIIQARNYGTPDVRVSTILGAIPGLSQPEERVLMQAVKKVVGQTNGNEVGASGLSGITAMTLRERNNGAIYTTMVNTIKNTKFQDPALEKIRKVAAQHWDDYSSVADSAIDRFVKYTEGDN